jgi:hypothetical protein
MVSLQGLPEQHSYNGMYIASHSAHCLFTDCIWHPHHSIALSAIQIALFLIYMASNG